jgi:predicted component of type VI protein secretion system
MAYLILTANGEEYERRELRALAPLVIGRAPDCDVAVRDIILSRHHCRIERTEDGSGWRIVDLHSKNGTHLRGQPVESHELRDGDELRIGRSRLMFKAGAFAASSKPQALRKNQPAVARPVDPHEALAGTVTGMVVCEPGETQQHKGMPMPKPRPADPESYADDGVYEMLNEIISSSWDSIQAQASQPTRMQRAMPVAGVTSANRAAGPGPIGVARPKPRVSFALQADVVARKGDEGTAPPPLQSRPLQPPSWLIGRLRSLGLRRAQKSWRVRSRRFWVVTSAGAAIVLIAGWITVAVRASHSVADDGATPVAEKPAVQAQPAHYAPAVAVDPDGRSGAPAYLASE